jgi:hypothetical protein
MAPPIDPPLTPAPGVPDHETAAHELEALQHGILGRWITSFDLEFPENGGFTPTVFLSCFEFKANGTFNLYQRRNKGGTYGERARGGDYTIGWDPNTGVAGGDITIKPSDGLVLHYLMRNSDELHFIIDGTGVPIPVAQGTMYKAELVGP